MRWGGQPRQRHLAAYGKVWIPELGPKLVATMRLPVFEINKRGQ